MNRQLFRILLMEDDAGDAEIIREAFRDARVGLTIDHVPDGEKGMSYLRREGGYAGAGRPDLILLDLNMPLKDGREVLSELKSDAGLRAMVKSAPDKGSTFTVKLPVNPDNMRRD